MQMGRKSMYGLVWIAIVAMAALFAIGGVRANAQVSAQSSTAGSSAAQARGLPMHPAVPASATDIVGVWQGTLKFAATADHPAMDLRLVFKISRSDAGALRAVWYSIDQGGQPAPVATVDFKNGVLKFTITVVPRSYEGTMSADGKTIAGTWMEGTTPMPLPLERATPDTAWPIPEPPKPMAADADPSFSVATIKPNNTGATQLQGLVIRGRQFITRASSVEDLLSFAYGVQSKQIINAPEWVAGDRFDIEALPDPEGVPNTHQISVMIQKLLADRFKLTFHHEQREMSAYVLEVAKAGPKLTVDQGKGNLPGLFFRPAPDGLSINVMNATMGDFTGFLQSLVLDRPVVDRTSLTGKYDFKVTFTPDDSQFHGHPPHMPSASGTDGAAETAAAPGLYEAIEEQLGLKLTAEKTAVDVIVIDHVEKPSPN